jgi:energy-coupling factor transporter ATP-binding protein EcfA2
VTAEAAREVVQARATALTSALDSGRGCLPSGDVARAEAALAKAAARTSITGGRTVVAFAGATGSGKSSLFNAITGAEVAQVGARRPTTATPTAAIWGSESSSDLLDWLMVGARYLVDPDPPRHHPPELRQGPGLRHGPGLDGGSEVNEDPGVDEGPGLDEDPGLDEGRGLDEESGLEGLVLLDLPDFDSRATAHRIEADRILDLVDVFIWVTDPQKYADARLHEGYIAQLSSHEAVTITVLNQADRLTSEALNACLRDLVRLLEADGVVDPEVIATSAISATSATSARSARSAMVGPGVDDLRDRIGAVVAGRNAAAQRLDSDLRSAAAILRSGVADSEPSLDDLAHASLVHALSRAAGIPVIVDAVERDYRREAALLTGWPVTRWVRALRPAPLRLLGLDKDVTGRPGSFSQSDVRSVLGRSSLPPATPAARSAVALATRELGDLAGRDLPQAWTDAVANAAMPSGADLGDALDQAVVGTSLRQRDPLWWTGFGALQWILALAAATGLIWLVVLMVLDWLRFPEVDTPSLGPLSYPFLLAAGGLLGGFLLSLLTRAMGRIGGRRRKKLVGARLHEAVTQVARDRLVAPVQEVLDRHRRTRESLDAACTRR